MSVRAFARALGVVHKAVQKGIASGRLRDSVGWNKNGQPFIADPELAVIEWTANRTRPSRHDSRPFAWNVAVLCVGHDLDGWTVSGDDPRVLDQALQVLVRGTLHEMEPGGAT